MSITDQKPFVVTDGHIPRTMANHMVCGFCMHQFVPGETARWVFCPGAPNTYVCVDCDGDDVPERFAARWRDVILPILRRWGGYS